MDYIVLWYLLLKNPHISGPVPFIPVMFKTQLYFKTGIPKAIYSTVTFSVLVGFVFCFFSSEYVWIFLIGSKPS